VNPNIITTIASAVALVIALWTITSHFDKRNSDRFDALEKQIEATKEVLRAETRQMRAEIKLEIREEGDRRVRG
jgi:hypothetical protein